MNTRKAMGLWLRHGLLRGLIAVAFLSLACCKAMATPLSLMIDQAQIAQGECTAPSSSCTWQAASLPDHWGISKRRGIWTYRVTLPVPAAALKADNTYALWLPRAGDRLELWLNGVPLAHFGRVHEGEANYGHQPLWVPISAALLHAGDNELRISAAAGPPGSLYGVSRIHWGQADAVYPDYQQRYRWTVGGAMGRLLLCIMAGLIGLGIAWRMRNLHALLFAVCSGLWCVRESLKMLTEPWPNLVGWYALTVGAFGLTLLCGSWLQLRMLHMRARWLKGLALLALLAWPPCVWQALQHPQGNFYVYLVNWMYVTMFVGTATTVYAWAAVWRHPSKSNLMIALGCLGCVLLSFSDNWITYLSGNPLGFEHLALTPYMSIALLVSISAAMYVRVDRAFQLEAAHKAELEHQVQAQRQELETLHAREQARTREQAVATERARLMRDMHDGLGSHLVGLMSTVQSGRFTQDELTEEVRDAMDQLRLTIDSLEPLGGDLSSLLGQLRFRLEPRLRKLGIHVDWRVGELPGAEHFGTAELASLSRLLHEVFSNIIKHARASRVTVRGHADETAGQHIIEVHDDGQGFDPDALHAANTAHGRGLRNMALRAAQLGGHWALHAAPGQGCRVRLALPLQRASQASS